MKQSTKDSHALASTFAFSPLNAQRKKAKELTSQRTLAVQTSGSLTQKSLDPKNNEPLTSATRQVRQRWFSVGIFPLRHLFGLTGNRPQSAPACSFLRYMPILAGV
jgi:hypothetical protein